MLNKYEDRKEKLNISESRSSTVLWVILAAIVIVIHIILLVVLFSEL